jgi:outer membrane murein-binding lipoprotein Lpp
MVQQQVSGKRFAAISKCYIAKPLSCLRKKGNLLIANKTGKVSVSSIIVAALVVVLVGMACLIYSVYIPQIDQLNSQVVDKNQQIDSLNATVSSLNSQVQDLQETLSHYTAQLSTALGVKELVDNNTNGHYLYIRGDVTNNGVTTAYNAGLHVVGYGANHEVLVDMTSSIDGGTFPSGFTSATYRSQLYPTQSLSTILSIYHSGNVTSWDITPVWTNSP